MCKISFLHFNCHRHLFLGQVCCMHCQNVITLFWSICCILWMYSLEFLYNERAYWHIVQQKVQNLWNIGQSYSWKERVTGVHDTKLMLKKKGSCIVHYLLWLCEGHKTFFFIIILKNNFWCRQQFNIWDEQISHCHSSLLGSKPTWLLLKL